MMFRFNVVLLLNVLSGLISRNDGQCTWPTEFNNTNWWDSAKGTMVFTSNQMTGISFTISSSTIDTWDCVSTDHFASEGILLFKSTNTFPYIGGDWTSYLCIEFNAVVGSGSYRYYRVNGQEQNAGEERVYINPSTTETDKTIICDTTNRATGAEFSYIVKQGSEDSSKITCPSPLLGRFDFDFTDSGGTVSCNNASDPEHMNVCTDKTTLGFDVPCTGQSIVYADASVYCMASVTVGTDTFVQLYNPQGSPDDSTTFKFSCMAISSDSLSATIVYRNCTNHQTSTYVPRSHDGTVIGASISFTNYVFCKGGCTWPSVFASSTWRDNTHGDLTFTTNTMSGFDFVAHSSTINNWECLVADTFDTDGYLILKSTDTFSFIAGTFVTYMCLSMTQVSNDSYYYYQMHSVQSNAANERVKINIGDTLTTRAQICESVSVPAAEFHVLVKSGAESAAKQYCPPALLAQMDYVHTDSSGTVTCNGSTDDWDVCTDRMVMTFDYGTCGTEMAYSATGTVWCMVNITSTYQYVVVYNTDGSPTHKFACFVVASDGLSASVVYNNCTENMTPTTAALRHDGTTIGSLLTMTPNITCPFLGDATAAASSSSSSSILPIIIGAVVGILLIVIIVAITCYCMYRKKKRNNSVEHEDKKEKPPDGAVGNGEVIILEDAEPVHPEPNPVFTVHPDRNTLTPIPKNDAADAASPCKLPPIQNKFKTKI